MASAAPAPITDPAKLRSEWRGFLVGSWIVLLVAIFTMVLLLTQGIANRLPKPAANQTISLAETYAAVQASLRAHPPLTILLVWGAAVIGLFVLNLRFSRLLGRPRGALARSLWPAANFIAALLFAYILPELVMLFIFGRWVRQALRRAPSEPR